MMTLPEARVRNPAQTNHMMDWQLYYVHKHYPFLQNEVAEWRSPHYYYRPNSEVAELKLELRLVQPLLVADLHQELLESKCAKEELLEPKYAEEELSELICAKEELLELKCAEEELLEPNYAKEELLEPKCAEEEEEEEGRVRLLLAGEQRLAWQYEWLGDS